jgi:class 3 adenylate cyclase
MADLPAPDDQRPLDRGAGGLTERVADADRDRTVTLLREHVVEGRLTLDEFSERVGLALEARTRGDLQGVMADLPQVSAEHLPVPSTAPPRQKRRWHVAVMSGHSTKGRWRISGKTNAVAIMGGCDMDLRRAEIEGPEVEITAFAFWGGIDIIVPEGFDVELRGFSFMGGRDLKLRDVPIVRGSPRIVVRGFAIMGGIDVKSRPNRSGKRRARGGASGELGDTSSVADPEDLAALGLDIRRQLGTERPEQRSDQPGSDGVDRAGAPAEPDSTRPADGTVTILFCDMVDYAGMTERLGDQASREILREHHRIVRDAIARHGGREINVQGDGFMVAFGGVARALRCAIGIQRAFRVHVPADGGDPIAVHIGVHTGDALDEGDDLLGHTVIVASRLADAAGAGEILVSSLSEQLVQGSGEFTFDGHRETRLKGMARAQLSATLAWVE